MYPTSQRFSLLASSSHSSSWLAPQRYLAYYQIHCAIMMSSNSTDGDSFCSGPGYVMNSGFQLSKGGYCLMFLFQSAVIDTAGKYVACLFLTLLMGMTEELLRISRTILSQQGNIHFRKLPQTTFDIMLSLLYALQMIFAYWLMLLVMMYEYVVFIFVILGLTIGNFVATRIQRSYLGAQAELLSVSGSPCCGDGGACQSSQRTPLRP